MSGKRTLAEAGWDHPRARPPPPGPGSQRDASSEPTESTESTQDDTEDLSTGITGREPIMDPPGSPRTLEGLQEEIESLEAIVDQLDTEKHALKMRLNQVENLQRFSIGDCKKWLANNFEFDRKDTPELLAGIFENYLLQNDTIEPLPHQLIIKNSSRAQSRRDKIAIARFNLYQRKEKDKIPEPPAPKPRKTARTANRGNDSDPGAYGQYLYVNPDYIEALYASKPWVLFLDKWPKLRPAGKAANFDSLVRLQDDFLEKNVVAIWERTHWFPIKMELGKTAGEIKLLGRHHNRRKRRQALLKERIESLNVELKSKYERALLDQSIFGNRWVGIIMRRPTLWLPRENESLLAQLREIDEAEPERNYNFAP